MLGLFQLFVLKTLQSLVVAFSLVFSCFFHCVAAFEYKLFRWGSVYISSSSCVCVWRVVELDMTVTENTNESEFFPASRITVEGLETEDKSLVLVLAVKVKVHLITATVDPTVGPTFGQLSIRQLDPQSVQLSDRQWNPVNTQLTVDVTNCANQWPITAPSTAW